MEQLKMIKDTLIGQIQSQMANLQCVDAKELGEVVDMVKDLEEAIYYCTIVEAMEEKKEQGGNTYYYTENHQHMPTPMENEWDYPYQRERDMDKHYGKMYYADGGSSRGGGGANNGSSNSGSSGSSGGSGGRSYYSERDLPVEFRDQREGRSPMQRRMYMESKEMHQGKEVSMKELEKYMQELSSDISEMIKDATPEEKQLLQKKIAVLATKINV